MKRFTDFNTKNLTGGAPFANEHFYTVQQEVYKVLARLAGNAAEGLQFSGTSSPNCIVEGVEYSGSAGNYSLSAGIVRLGDDIYEFDGASGLSAPTRIQIDPSPPVEQKQYKDGGTKDFFETRKANLNASASAPFIQIDFADQDNTLRLGNKARLNTRIKNFGNDNGISNNRVLGRSAGGTGPIEELTVAATQALLQIFANSISNNRMLGRTAGGSGAIEQLTANDVLAFLGIDADPKVINDGNTGSDDQLKMKIFEIGDWNIDTTSFVVVDTPGIRMDKARIWQATIVPDDDIGTPLVTSNDLNRENAGFVIYGNTVGLGDPEEIILHRVAGGILDNTVYDKTSYNRGWVCIVYEDQA